MTATVPNNDCVICPKCTWQFRAIPVNVQKALSVLEDVRGNINPERGFAEELEADVAKLIVELEAQATWVPSGPAAVMRHAAAALATTVVQGEPVAWRYTDSRGHFRYRGAPWLGVAEYTYLKPEPLFATPAPSPKEAADWIDKLPYGEGMTAMKAAIRAALATRGPIGEAEPTESQKIEAILAAADEWAGYVEADRAPMTLSKYLERAILALSRTPGQKT